MNADSLLHRHPAFSLRTADEWFGHPGQTASMRRLRRLQDKGRVVGVFRGVYAAVPPGVNPETFQVDPFLALNALRPDCVFCGHSALELHGVAHQTWSKVVAYSAGKAANYETRYGTFSLVKRPPWLTENSVAMVDRRATLIAITSPELTVIEGFRYPARVGGIEEFLKSALGFERLNSHVLVNLLDRFAMRKLYAAVGWLLTQNQERWAVSDSLLDKLRSNRPSSAQYLERGSAGSVFVKEWNLLIPREVACVENSDFEA